MDFSIISRAGSRSRMNRTFSLLRYLRVWSRKGFTYLGKVPLFIWLAAFVHLCVNYRRPLWASKSVLLNF